MVARNQLLQASDRLVELLRSGNLDVVLGRMPDAASAANQDCLFEPIDRQGRQRTARRRAPRSCGDGGEPQEGVARQSQTPRCAVDRSISNKPLTH